MSQIDARGDTEVDETGETRLLLTANGMTEKHGECEEEDEGKREDD